MSSTAPVPFHLTLFPHRSLSARGFRWVMLLVGGLSFILGTVFFLAGAWPVLGFFGLDVALIYLAFRLNYRGGRAFEEVSISQDQIHVRRVDHWGQETAQSLPAAWATVRVDDPPASRSRVLLRSHGRELEIGGFLPPQEHLDVAEEVQKGLDAYRAGPAEDQT